MRFIDFLKNKKTWLIAILAIALIILSCILVFKKPKNTNFTLESNQEGAYVKEETPPTEDAEQNNEIPSEASTEPTQGSKTQNSDSILKKSSNGTISKSSTSASNTTTSKSNNTSNSTSKSNTSKTNSPPAVAAKGKNIVGYYMSWSRYKGILPENLGISKLTHLNYAFAKINSDLTVAMSDSNVDTPNFASLRNLKNSNKNLRTIISIGGWDYSKYFSDAALNDANRKKFAKSCVNFVLTHGFDGVDIDWEYPIGGGLVGNINRAADKQNFTLLMQELRSQLNAQTAKDKKTYNLTSTVAPGSWYLTKIEASKLVSYVDFLILMCYDMNGPWDDRTNHNAPLYARTDIPGSAGNDIENGVKAYTSAGVPASKLLLGVPFYGYKYTVNSLDKNGIGSTFSAAGSITYDNVAADYIGKAAYTLILDNISKVPYIFGNDKTFISFDNEQSLATKAAFVKNKGLAGIGIWELSQDKSGKLLATIKNNL